MNVKNTRTIGKIVTLSIIASTMIHATNGDNLIAVGTKARGMGGTGIALSHGAESALSNPALISSVEGTEISFGGTLFMPDISTSLSGFVPPQEHRSDANRNIIPEVSIAHKIDDNWYIGVGMFGTAGMGTDYRNATLNPAMGQLGNLNMVTNLQLLQFAIPVSYKAEGFSIAVAPILQYGNLDMNYNMPNPMTGSIDTIGAGVAQDFGLGWSLGASYDFSANGVEGLTLGAVYKSAIEMEYDQQLSTATGPFAAMGIFPAPMSDILEQPAEYGAGLAYVMDQHTFAFDYKKIKWSDAEGYKDFGWEDSDVYAFGYEYAQDNWALRAGYNYASSAVVGLNGAGTPAYGATSAINFFNLLGFPATAEKHYTFGGTYEFTNAFSLDLAYVYSPTNTEEFDIGAFAGTFGIDTIATDHQEDSVSFQLTFKF